MKRIFLFLIALLCLVNISCAQETLKAEWLTGSQIKNSEIVKSINENADLFPNNTQLSLAFIDGDETTYIGVIRREDKLEITSNEDRIFEIGSISKVFTSVLFSKLVGEKKMSVDDNLLSTLGLSSEKASEESKKITLQMLANHTSGLPAIPANLLPIMVANQKNPYKGYKTDMLEDFFEAQIIVDNEPNTTYSYSNLGAGTLGYMVTKKSKMSYEDFLQQTILKPLKMTNSSSILSQIDSTKLVIGLGRDGLETDNWDFTDALVGAGGIKSSAIDMEKFIRKNFEDDEVYNLPQKTTFTVNPNFQLGLGWHISIQGEKKLHWHNGGTGGYRSCMVLDKENKKAVLVLSNVSAFGDQSNNIDMLSFDLIQKI